MKHLPKFAIAICLLAVLGIVVSAYALHLHYKPAEDSFCNISGTFNCDVVNQSIYAVFMGVPVALIGIIGYVVIIALALMRAKVASGLLLAGAVIGLGFSLYLTYVEAFLLGTYCILCLTSLAVILLITLLSSVRLLTSGRVATAS